jgi:hypothetical protein
VNARIKSVSTFPGGQFLSEEAAIALIARWILTFELYYSINLTNNYGSFNFLVYSIHLSSLLIYSYSKYHYHHHF